MPRGRAPPVFLRSDPWVRFKSQGGARMSVRIREVIRWSGMIALGLLCAGARPAAADQLTTFTALLNGAQENPPVASPSQGVAFITFNKDNLNLCYAISFSPLQSAEILAHFH